MIPLSSLRHAVAAAFVLLAVATVMHWRRHRDPSRAYLATALGMLGIVAVLGELRPLAGPWRAPVAAAQSVTFLASGYALLGLRHSFLPLTSRARQVVRGLMIATAISTTAIALARTPGTPMTSLQAANSAWFALLWSATVGESAYRFWRAAGGRPAVQRARLRSIALGYGCTVAVLLLTVLAALSPVTQSDADSMRLARLLQVLSLAVVPLMYASFAPPSWLRHLWRRPEEQALRRATNDLVLRADHYAALCGRALEWAVRLVGAEGGVIVAPNGSIAAALGVRPDQATALAREVGSTDAREPGTVRLEAHRMLVRLGDRGDTLLIVAGPFTPLFGTDEAARLQDYGGSIAIALDRVRAADRLARETSRNQSLLTAISDMDQGVIITHDGAPVYANDAYLRLVGYSRDELMALPSLAALAPESVKEDLLDRYQRRLRGEVVPDHYDTELVHRDGHRIDVEVATNMLTGDEAPRAMTIVRDISERKQAQAALAALGRTDSLTGIANRRAWEYEIEAAVARARRDGSPLTVAMLDLDRFKAYNDDWGHQRGDELLARVAAAWRAELREVDVVARYGGDEFAVLLPGCGVAEAAEVLDRVRLAAMHWLPASVGAAGWDGVEGIAELVARADAALYDAKKNGGNQVVLAGLRREGDLAVSWSQKLVTILARRELTSVYQPILDLRGKSLVGYEALARPVAGRASDSVEELFAAANRLGFSRDLDWLARRAAVHGAHDIPGGCLLFINVGLWALLDPLHDVDQMMLLLRWAGRAPGQVVLEMSEREVISDLDRLTEVLAQYRAEGFRFALDDVGEGHSTLEVLAAAEPEYIKIARSLTQRSASGGAGAAIRALVTFAASTGAEVVAEGIEDEAMVRNMVDLGVTLGQGYGLGRPAAMPLTSRPLQDAMPG